MRSTARCPSPIGWCSAAASTERSQAAIGASPIDRAPGLAIYFRSLFHEESKMGSTIEFQRPDGQVVQGYLAEPQQGSEAPSVVVIQEW